MATGAASRASVGAPPTRAIVLAFVARAMRSLWWDVRGSVFAEYVVVLAVVAVGAALAVMACGVPLLELYRAQVAWIGLPIP